MISINGMAHVQLTVSNYEAAREFYGKLLPFLGLTPVMEFDGFYYCVGGRTGVAISRAGEEHRSERFVQRRVGLHHVCFRARERGDVDRVYELVREMGATVVHAKSAMPGMIDAPGSFSGSRSSPRPARGPDPSQRTSFAIFMRLVASVLSAPEVKTVASWPASAANLLGALTNGRPVSSARRRATRSANSGCEFSPSGWYSMLNLSSGASQRQKQCCGASTSLRG